MSILIHRGLVHQPLDDTGGYVICFISPLASGKAKYHPKMLLTNLMLVGDLKPSEKYQSIAMIIPNIWEKKCSKPPTRKKMALNLKISKKKSSRNSPHKHHKIFPSIWFISQATRKSAALSCSIAAAISHRKLCIAIAGYPGYPLGLIKPGN